MSCPVETISVLRMVGASPGFRDSAAVLFGHVPEGVCELVLDFTGVTFISRGFADELHQLRQVFQVERKVPVTIENANADIMAMMSAVSTTQQETAKSEIATRVIRIADSGGLKDLLLGS